MARQFLTSDSSIWQERFGNGSAGAYSTSGSLTDSSRSGYSNTTFAGTSGDSTGTAGAVGNFVAGDLVLIHQSRNGGTGAGVWELNKISSTGAGTNWTLVYPLQNTYATTGQVYRLLQYSSIDINAGHTLTGVAWNGTTGGIVALLCNGTTTVAATGVISTTGKGYLGGAAMIASDSGNVGRQGEGTAGAAGTQSTSDNGNGGHGGNATATNSYQGGGGLVGGLAGLTTMVFGGGGGSGGCEGGTSEYSGAGGIGGGLVLIISKNITITGSIVTNGNTGGAGGNTNASGGGGGNGGAVLVKGQTLTLGTNLITVAAGAGGAKGSGASCEAGEAGGTGYIHADYSQTIGTSSTTPALDSTIDTIYNEQGGTLTAFEI